MTRSRPSRLCLLLALTTAVLAGPARCQTLVTSRAALAGSDAVDWAVMGDDAYPLSDPFRIGSAAGLSVSVSEAGHGLYDQYGGVFDTIRQAGTPLGEGTLNGNFAPGDIALYAMDGGVVSLTFPRGVYGGGAQLAVPTPTPSGAGAFTVQVQAFGQDGALLGSFTRGGTFSAKGDNSAPFVGIVDAAPDIYRLSYTATSPHYGFFLNRFDIATRPVAPAPSVAHILWTNPDGRATLWFVNPDNSYGLLGAYGPYAGAGVAPATITVGPGGPADTWKALAVATGPDGVSRLLWTNPDGRATLWFVNPDGTHGVSGAYGPYEDGGGLWQARAVAVGPDNVARILWTAPDGRATLWYVNPDGTYGVSGAYGPYADAGGIWRAGALSVGPDGVAHILWTNPDGRATLWFVNPDDSYGLVGAYGPYADSGGVWRAAALATGANGVSRLLWTAPDGRATLWFVNANGSYGVSGAYGPYVDGGGVWQAGAVAAGPDNVARLLWTNPDGRATLWFVNPDTTYGLSGAYGPYIDSGGVWRAVADSAGP